MRHLPNPQYVLKKLVLFLETSFALILLLTFSQGCNQSYKPDNPDTALPPGGWENTVILTSAQCNQQTDFLTFTLASQYPLFIGLTQNQMQIQYRCFNLEQCQISDPLNPTCSGTAWLNAPNGTVNCTINNNMSNSGCSTTGCSINSGETSFSCYAQGINAACNQGIVGQRVCQILQMPIGINGFPQSISYDFRLIGPRF